MIQNASDAYNPWAIIWKYTKQDCECDQITLYNIAVKVKSLLK